MPFIPHTPEDVRSMLATIGVDRIDALFDEIPQDLRCGPLAGVPAGMSEMEIAHLMEERARRDAGGTCFIGAGAYDHHIPAAVWEIATRGEFYTAYTPYQAEASQGTLQLLYEYQTMMANLMALDVSNASLYDGASALAEAVLMAVRLNRASRSRRVLMPQTVHPLWRNVVRSVVSTQGIEIVEVPCCTDRGNTPAGALAPFAGGDFAALVIPQPNFFGVLEDVDALADWGVRNKSLVIGAVNPLAMTILKPPGQWGSQGADIACGEGQPLGIPLSSGGPYFGFLCARMAHVRQMPGRIVGRTVDLDGRTGFALTLQAREQHIRRSKATSNICTNQGLCVTAATIHMAMLGAEGLRRAAAASHANTRALADRLCALPGVQRVFSGPFFHEVVLRVPGKAAEALHALAAHGVLGGYALGDDYPGMDDALLVCATEKRTADEIARYGDLLERILALRTQAQCPVQPKM